MTATTLLDISEGIEFIIAAKTSPPRSTWKALKYTPQDLMC
jgi:hypothetical protein